MRRGPLRSLVALLSFVFIAGVSALELLVAAIQAYVFALLTALYITTPRICTDPVRVNSTKPSNT